MVIMAHWSEHNKHSSITTCLQLSIIASLSLHRLSRGPAHLTFFCILICWRILQAKSSPNGLHPTQVSQRASGDKTFNHVWGLTRSGNPRWSKRVRLVGRENKTLQPDTQREKKCPAPWFSEHFLFHGNLFNPCSCRLGIARFRV